MDPVLRKAILGLPIDRGHGGGFMLLSRLGRALRERNSKMVWVDFFFDSEAA